MSAVRGTILLVDDEEKILKRLGRALRDEGHDVGEAASARDALRHLTERQFDLVVIDNVMQGMTGLELVRELSTTMTDSERPQMVLMTAHGSTQIVRDAFKMGVEDSSRSRSRWTSCWSWPAARSSTSACSSSIAT